MRKYIIKRLLWMIPVILGVTFLVFSILYFTPGDPAAIKLGADATPEKIQELREEWGLNDSFVVRFGKYCYNAFLKFDLGKSYFNNRSISQEIASRYPNTLIVAFLSVFLALLIGMPFGIMSAVNQYTWKDNVSMLFALLGVSMPSFWVGLMLSLLFALKLGWLPATGFAGPSYWVLPCVSIALAGAGNIARQTRSSMLEVIRQDYITTARAKGQTEGKVIYYHALKNALIPVITTAGSLLDIQLGGAVIAEAVFAVPGIGTYMVSAIKSRDYIAVQGSVLVIAITFSLLMLAVDILYAYIDPRIKSKYQSKKKEKHKVNVVGKEA